MGRIYLPALVCVLALFTTACGAAGDGASDGGSGESLSDFFGGPEMDDPEAAEAHWREQETQAQEAIAACMAKQGFEYVPVQQPEGSYTVYDEADREEEVRTMGFHITTWYGNEDEMPMDEATEWHDPNQDYVEGLSEGEREAYYEALHGDPEEHMTTEVDPETGEEIMVGSGFGGGCEGETREEQMGDPEAQDKLWEELQPAFEEMHQRVQADPRIVEANGEYSACMADRGYDIASRDELWESVHEDFQQRFDEIVGPNGGYADPFEGWAEDEIDAFFEEKSEEEIEAFFAEAEQQSKADIDEEALEALQQEEIDMAVADFECGKDMEDLHMEVSQKYEKDLIAEHRDTLEEIRDLQESGA